MQNKNCVACEEEETVEHMVFDCQLYNGIRIENFNTDRQNISALIDDQAKYEQFSNYVKTLFEIRSTYLMLLDTGQTNT